MLERVLVQQSLAVSRAQDRELEAGERQGLLDEVGVVLQGMSERRFNAPCRGCT